MCLVAGSLFFANQTNAEVVTTSVTVTICGDNAVDGNEQCDDGGTVSGDGCSSSCQLEGPICGNGTVETGEQCDDGNGLSGDGCSASCIGEGGGSGIYIPPPAGKTTVIAIGKAYPASRVTLLVDGAHKSEVTADSFGGFRFELENTDGGTFTFGFFAIDIFSARSLTFNFTTSISPYTLTTIGGILLPPTLMVNKAKASAYDIVTLRGSSAPSSRVTIEIQNNNKKMTQSVRANSGGIYEYDIFTHLLGAGIYQIRVKAESEDLLISTYSQVISFRILTNKEMTADKENPEIAPEREEKNKDIKPPYDFSRDINGDSFVNLTDLSIMFYYWKTSNPLTDFNNDGITNIFDFSILIYWWTG